METEAKTFFTNLAGSERDKRAWFQVKVKIRKIYCFHNCALNLLEK